MPDKSQSPSLKSSRDDDLVLTLDVGTSSVRAILIDTVGQSVPGTSSRITHSLDTSSDGTAIFDPAALLKEVESCIDSTLLKWRESAGGRTIRAVAMSQLVSNVLGIDNSDSPLTPVLTYADTRSAPQVENLRRTIDEVDVHQRTGCRLHTSFLPARFLWIYSIMPEVASRTRMWLSIGEWLLLRWLGKTKCSLSVAAWSGLLNRNALDWDETLLEILPLRREQLPPLNVDGEFLAGLLPDYASRWPELQKAYWFPAVGDGFASNVGSGCVDNRRTALSIGTSGAMRVLIRNTVTLPHGLYGFAVDRNRLLVGGAMNDAGSVLAWMRDTLRIESDWQNAVVKMTPDSHGLTILPFLTGERSPGWHSHARFTLSGVTPETTSVELLRAALESVALRFAAIAEQIEQVEAHAMEIIASGGGLNAVPGWIQILADVLGRPVTASTEPEASARGAALIALEELEQIQLGNVPVALGETSEPDPARHSIYRDAFERQKRLYNRFYGM